MACSLDDLDMLEADAAHLRRKKIGSTFDVVLVLGKSADAGNAEEIFQLCKKPRLILPSVIKSWGRHLEQPLRADCSGETIKYSSDNWLSCLDGLPASSQGTAVLQAFQQFFGSFEFGKESFLVLKSFGMNAASAAIQLDWMLQVQHLVINEIFHCITRHVCAIEDPADDNCVVGGIVMSKTLA